ncbi:hypothetical protein RF55_13098, partial [Lasius niger]
RSKQPKLCIEGEGRKEKGNRRREAKRDVRMQGRGRAEGRRNQAREKEGRRSRNTRRQERRRV